MRTLTAEEIRIVAEINERAQRLDIIKKAKTLGFILGLGAEESDMAQVQHHARSAAIQA